MHSWTSVALRALLTGLALVPTLRGQEAKVVEKEGRVVITKAGTKPVPAEVGVNLAARDRLGTGEASRAVLKMSEKWFARVDEETDVEITPSLFTAKDKEALKVSLGGAFIYSREPEGELKVQTPTATGGLRGTQLFVRVLPDGKTFMQVLEGEVDLSNDAGTLKLKSGEAGEAEVGHAPQRTAVIETRNLLQWALYYPAVLVPDQLGLTAADQRSLAGSLEAYSAGDLLGAREKFPTEYAAASDATKLHLAGVMLATGQVDKAQRVLQDIDAGNPNRRALERMLAAVLGTASPDLPTAPTAAEFLADSYYQQSRRQLEAARTAARHATELAPQSGFAWTRLAELEFSFGRTRQAMAALDKGIALTPKNAQAHALRGYLLSAENNIEKAQKSFETAVQLDGGLGNAWLGLGLTKIKQGHLAEGRTDLQTAATVEPTRSFFYSYHGKALNLAGDFGLARKDFALAKQLDPADPTPWLYSAIQAQQESRYSAAIADMQESQRLNNNRQVYRSGFLLDQDQAVRSSNLAAIYQNNGMIDLSVREATRATERDYTNASAHQFLANSLDALRDPQRVSLRYETAWFNEQLLAYLLAPVGGGPLSQLVSQQEYSRLLAPDGGGGSLTALWRDDGYLDATASVFGNRDRLSGGLDILYHKDNGIQANTDNERTEVYGQVKYQVTADDMLYGLVKWARQESETGPQTVNNTTVDGGQNLEEKQEPGLALAGWNHEWAPGIHTLFLGGRLAAEQTLTAPDTVQLLLQRNSAYLQSGFLRPKAGGGLEYTSDVLRNPSTPPVSSNPDGSLKLSPDFQQTIAPYLGIGPVTGVFSDRFDFDTNREFKIYSAELQQIWQTSRNTLIAGSRWQSGDFDATATLLLLNHSLVPLFTEPAAEQQINADFLRYNFYAYDYLAVTPQLTLIAGVTWDHLEHPDNFRNPPLNDRQDTVERANPKFGFTFSPSPAITIRGAYTEALGGVTFDESVRLEPVQIAGFNQAFRTVISESVVGSVEAPVYKNYGLSAEGALSSRTWWAVTGHNLTEEVTRTVGAFDILSAPIFPNGLAILPAGTIEQLDYREKAVTAGINQLVGTEFALGLTYRFTDARLRSLSPQIPTALAASADRVDKANLQEWIFNSNWNSPTGWFAQADATLFNQGHTSTQAGAPVTLSPTPAFWYLNAQVGHRFRHNQWEIAAGVLNLGDRDYQLDPLIYDRILPRERTFFVRCRLNF